MKRTGRKRPPSDSWKKSQGFITEDDRAFVRLTGDLLDRLAQLMAEQNKTQKDLAGILGKHPSEVNKFFHLGYNFTLKTIAKLEAALNAPLLVTSLRYQARQEATLFGSEREAERYLALRREALNKIPQLAGGSATLTPQTTVEVSSPESVDAENHTTPSYAMAA